MAGKLLISVLTVLLVAGCAAPKGNLQRASLSGTSLSGANSGPLLPADIQSNVMDLGDNYNARYAQACDELMKSTTDPEIRSWALRNKIATYRALVIMASESNPIIALLDTLVYTRLKRQIIEEYYSKNVLKDHAEPILKATKKGEDDVWALGARVLTKSQLDELDAAISDWRKANPDQYYIAEVRIDDFAAFRKALPQSSGGSAPTSIFGLLYIDPLAKLDPVAREIQESRIFAERLMYVLQRLPAELMWMSQLVVMESLSMPETRDFLKNTGEFSAAAGKFAGSTDEFADAVKSWPDVIAKELDATISQLSKEMTAQREGAIKGLNDAVTAQREALMKDVGDESKKLHDLLSDFRLTVEAAKHTGDSFGNVAKETTESAEQATTRILNHAFWLVLALIGVVLVGAPISAAAMRRARR